MTLTLKKVSKISKTPQTNTVRKFSPFSDFFIVFDMIRHITDPEHPNTLEELAVLNLEDIFINLDTYEV